MPSSNFALHISSKVMLLLALTFFAAYGAPPAHAQYTETVPYTFTGGSDGAAPASGLIFDSKGNLYGTAVNGGNTSGSNCPGQNPPTGCGVVFELTPPGGGTGPWTETVLYTFQGGSDGAYPQSSLIFDAKGNLYGTTSNGGNMSGNCSGLGGCGVVFELSPPSGGKGAWTETVLYTFQEGNDGAFPYSSLIFDSQGNLYGTTSGGGSGSNGVVFELSPPSGGHGPWTETPLYSFQGSSDGGSPLANVIFDSSGNLYGTTYTGAHSYGVVFELSPPSGGSGSWTEDVLYIFTGHADGGFPFAGLIFDTTGNLYGTTALGGLTSGQTCKKTTGCGVVFQLSPPTGGSGDWTETPIYTFTANTDGGYPYAGVIFDSAGKNLYGTTAQGGDISGTNCSASVGCGVVFELTPPTGGTGPWNEIVQYAFTGGSDGGFPYAAPLFDATGNLFGTASYGGDSSGSNCSGGGCGVVYELSSEVAPAVKLSPSSLNFGNQIVGKTGTPKTVTVTNVGSATLDFTSITASGDFAITSNTCGATLDVGASCKVKVTFTPTQLGARTGGLTFTDNAPNSPQQVQLSGTGVSEVTLTPASSNYGKKKVGTTSKPKKFTLTNNQTATLSSIVISTTGDFAVQSTTCGSTLASKGKCTINVTFTPTKTGSRTGQLSVSDNAPGSPQTASLTGTGT